ncbi:hypothetical protein [Nocardia miyunensis]|uniref:hypothetical protein n=1 Tax=Nocardia miyunensis TaxID=282684 RepID=UPI003F76FAF8
MANQKGGVGKTVLRFSSVLENRRCAIIDARIGPPRLLRFSSVLENRRCDRDVEVVVLGGVAILVGP